MTKASAYLIRPDGVTTLFLYKSQLNKRDTFKNSLKKFLITYNISEKKGRIFMSKITKAIIPAAGLGTRFLPATKSIPKEMFPIIDTPTLQHIAQEAK